MIRGHHFVAIAWRTVTLTFLLTLTRIYVRVYLRSSSGLCCSESWKWSEYFVISAWLIFFIEGICISISNSAGWYNYNPNFQQTDEEVILSYKVNYFSVAVYMQCMYSVKAAMLCFYNEVVTREMRKLWWSIRVAGVLVFVGAVTSACVLLFGCWPISRNWSLGDDACAPILDYNIDITIMVFHLATDLIVWTFPFFLLSLLRDISTKEKISAAGMFALGTFCVFCAAWTQATSWWGGTSGSIATVLGMIVEMTTAVTVACAPAFKVFVTRTKRKTIMSRSSKRTEGSTVKTLETLKSGCGIIRTIDGDGDVREILPSDETRYSSTRGMLRMENRHVRQKVVEMDKALSCSKDGRRNAGQSSIMDFEFGV